MLPCFAHTFPVLCDCSGSSGKSKNSLSYSENGYGLDDKKYHYPKHVKYIYPSNV